MHISARGCLIFNYSSKFIKAQELFTCMIKEAAKLSFVVIRTVSSDKLSKDYQTSLDNNGRQQCTIQINFKNSTLFNNFKATQSG